MLRAFLDLLWSNEVDEVQLGSAVRVFERGHLHHFADLESFGLVRDTREFGTVGSTDTNTVLCADDVLRRSDECELLRGFVDVDRQPGRLFGMCRGDASRPLDLDDRGHRKDDHERRDQ